MLALLTAASLGSFSLSTCAATDPVIFTFSTVGDTRQDPTKADTTTLLPPATGGMLLPQDAQWLQNTHAWARILRTVQSQKANLLFVNGDMIMGYGRTAVPSAWGTTAPATPSAVVNSDLVKFYTQYAYWRGMISNMFETNTYVVPVPGNHEIQCNSAVSTNTGASACASGKHAYVENEEAWRTNMGDLIGDLDPAVNLRFQTVVGKVASNVSGLIPSTAPTSATDPVVLPAGGISTSQADLSYSFDINTAVGLLHFVVINTDAVGFDSHAPVGWLANDLSTAHSHGAVKFFVFGHKPAFTYDYLGNGLGTATNQVGIAGLDNDIPARNVFWKLIAQYNATYFSGHEHTTKIDTHADQTGTYTTTPWQVLVGSGGSPFDPKYNAASISPTDRYYAWATVRVHQSGAVTLDAYGFSDSFGPTQVIQSIGSLQ